MIPDCPTCSLSNVISFFTHFILYSLFYGIIVKNQYPNLPVFIRLTLLPKTYIDFLFQLC